MSRSRGPTVLTPRRFRLLLRLFPPFLAGRTRVVDVSDDFLRCRVRVRRSPLTRNLQGSIFGGTIFSAADPFFAMLYWQALARRGLRVQAWIRSARIVYLKPAESALTFEFEVAENEVRQALEALEREGRFARLHTTRAVDEQGQVCAVVELEVYLRRPRDDRREAAAF
ncbi:MAG TPA: DUF4442 domain-containing protein [Candidatus Polarisedimenticolaceae bacterium]|nr:DUF4442 domain-containing protein [Candidatus Polarisedimenticolaceae bacterium]